METIFKGRFFLAKRSKEKKRGRRDVKRGQLLIYLESKRL